MGRNNADFHGVTYKYRFIPKGTPEFWDLGDRDMHHITAHLKGKEVGYLSYETLANDGNVHDIGVNPEHQRKGIATGMWNYAKQLYRQGIADTPPMHSDATSAAGYRWAMTTGDPVPERLPWAIEEDKENGIQAEPKDNNWKGKGYYGRGSTR